MIRKIIPSTLIGRSIIIIFVPIIIIVLLTSFVFYQTSWSIISKRLTESVVADINVLVKLIDKNLEFEAIKIAKEDFKMNAFLVSGGGSSDLLYPKNFNPIVSFEVYDLDLKKNKKYKIWRGESREEQMYPDLESDNSSKLIKNYHSLGDIVLPFDVEPEEYMLSLIHI